MRQSLRSCTVLGLLSLALSAGHGLAQAGSPGRDTAQTKAKETVEGTSDAKPKDKKMKPKTSPADTRRVEDGAGYAPTSAGGTAKAPKADCPPVGTTAGAPRPECKEGATDSTGAPAAPTPKP